MRRFLIIAALLLASCSARGGVVQTPVLHAGAARQNATSAISHIVVIMLENRSFDTYFGTYPGANGIPSNAPCNPDPVTGKCIFPYHDTVLNNYGGPHSTADMIADIDGGKLDGFVASAEKYRTFDPNPAEVMGYHTAAELPYYWSLANKYTLADNHFAATSSWSTMAHLYMVSGWSAVCSVPGDPMSCVSSNTVNPQKNGDYAWTDLTWLLHAHGVSWGYYVFKSSLMEPNDGGDGEWQPAAPNFLSLWNPMPGFDDVRIDGQEQNVQKGENFKAQALAGTLPAVSWVVPPFGSSDHPSVSVAAGQNWLRSQIDAVQSGPDWQSTVILVTWDEWGGFYDHVMPPVIDGQGFGFRTPLLVVGPMVKKGFIDHQLLSSDAYLKLIEDTFLSGERIDANDGRADSRPDVRERTAGLGDLRNDFVGSTNAGQ
jgi:phospholipase C